MNRAYIALLLLVFLSPLSRSSGQPDTEDAKLERHFKQYLDAEFKRHPQVATRAGNPEFVYPGHLARALAFERLDRLDDALADVTRAVEIVGFLRIRRPSHV